MTRSRFRAFGETRLPPPRLHGASSARARCARDARKAAGLELAVRAWWRGVPGRGATRREEWERRACVACWGWAGGGGRGLGGGERFGGRLGGLGGEVQGCVCFFGDKPKTKACGRFGIGIGALKLLGFFWFPCQNDHQKRGFHPKRFPNEVKKPTWSFTEVIIPRCLKRTNRFPTVVIIFFSGNTHFGWY